MMHLPAKGIIILASPTTSWNSWTTVVAILVIFVIIVFVIVKIAAGPLHIIDIAVGVTTMVIIIMAIHLLVGAFIAFTVIIEKAV